MEQRLPTFEECLNIVSQNDAFTHKVEDLDGYRFHIFNYRLANYEDFKNHPGSIEMRGLTFLETLESIVPRKVGYERYVHLHKFFNHGELGGFGGINGSKIRQVRNKEDGSLIIPIVVGRKIYFKTKGTFSSTMAQSAKQICKKKLKLRDFILFLDEVGLVPFFEFVSPWNKIVLDYEQEELILIQIRDKQTGSYIQINDFIENVWKQHFGIKIAPSFSSEESIDFWLEKAKTSKGIEGWVVQFENGHFVKVKTDEYFSLHHLLTENLTKENEIISWVLNETLDDVITQIPSSDVRRKYAVDIGIHIRGLLNKWFDEIQGIMIGLNPNRTNSRKKFALKHQENKFFGVLMKSFSDFENGNYNEEKAFDYLKDFVLKQTNKWEQAKRFLNLTGFSSEHSPYPIEE